MALFDFNPLSYLKDAYDKASSFVQQNVIQPVESTVSKIAGSVSNAVSNLNTSSLTGNISNSSYGGKVVPQPYLPPTPYSGAGPGGTLPAITPQSVNQSSGPQYSVNPAASSQQPTSTSSSSTVGAPLYSTYEGSTYTDAQGSLFKFTGGRWVQMSSGATPASFPASGGTPTTNNPGPINQGPTPYYAPTPATNQGTPIAEYDANGQITGFRYPMGAPGATGTGSSPVSYSNPTGLSGIQGGASALPGSLGGGFRSAGASVTNILPTNDEEKKNRQVIVNKANQSLLGNLGNFFGNTANASTTPGYVGPYAPSYYQNQGQNQSINPQASQQSSGGGFLSGLGSAIGNFFNPKIDTSKQYGTPISVPNVGNLGSALSNIGQTTTNFLGLTNQQANLLSTAFGPQSTANKSTGTTNQIPTGQEFANGTTGGSSTVKLNPTDTNSNFQKTIVDRATQTLALSNQHTAQLAQDADAKAQAAAIAQITGGGEVFFKSTNPQTGQIDVFGLSTNGGARHITPDEFQQKGLNISNIPSDQQLGSDLAKSVDENRAKLLDPVTNRPYTKEDFNLPDGDPNKTELDAKTKEITDAIAKYDLKNVPDVEQLRQSIALDEGLPSLQAQKKTLAENINAIIGQFENVADEVRNDPDFTAKLKSKRLAFMDDQKQRALAGFQRQLTIIDDQIQTASTNVATRMKDKLDEYNLEVNNVKELQAERDKIEAKIEKATDNDRQLLTTYLTQFGGTLWTDLPPDVQAQIKGQFNNPNMVAILQSGLKTQKDKGLALQLQNTLNRTPTNVTVNIPGLTNGNQQGRYVPRGTPGLNDTQADSLNTDITNAAQAVAAVQQSNDSDANKLAKINAITSRLRTAYISSSAALGIINSQFTGVQGQTTNISANNRDQEFGTDLSNELGLVKSMFLGSTKTKVAKEAEGRLLNKYGADYATKIQAGLKDYLK